MGQAWQRPRAHSAAAGRCSSAPPPPSEFPDLKCLPRELSFSILSKLGATDLCLAACVWDELANDDLLWHGLCFKSWGYCSAYNARPGELSYKTLYLRLDEGTLTFNANWQRGLQYFIENGILVDSADEIAKFVHHTHMLSGQRKQQMFKERRDIFDKLVEFHDYGNQFLPNALRRFFSGIQVSSDRRDSQLSYQLSYLVDKFSERFCACNPHLRLSKDTVFVVCFSLILLSVDLCSPHIRNKMSKREFIKNTIRAAGSGIDADLAGHLYDNVYLVGPVAPAEA